MRDKFSAVRTEMAAGFAGAEAKTEGLAVQMRVIQEDVIARIALLQEARSKPPKRTRKKN